MLMLHAKNTTGLGAADLTTIEVNHFRGAAGGHQIIADFVQATETQPSLFLTFSLSHLFRALTILIHTSNKLQ